MANPAYQIGQALGSIFNPQAEAYAKAYGIPYPSPPQQPQPAKQAQQPQSPFNIMDLMKNPAKAMEMYSKAQSINYPDMIKQTAEKHGIELEKANAFLQDINGSILSNFK